MSRARLAATVVETDDGRVALFVEMEPDDGAILPPLIDLQWSRSRLKSIAPTELRSAHRAA